LFCVTFQIISVGNESILKITEEWKTRGSLGSFSSFKIDANKAELIDSGFGIQKSLVGGSVPSKYPRRGDTSFIGIILHREGNPTSVEMYFFDMEGLEQDPHFHLYEFCDGSRVDWFHGYVNKAIRTKESWRSDMRILEKLVKFESFGYWIGSQFVPKGATCRVTYD